MEDRSRQAGISGQRFAVTASILVLAGIATAQTPAPPPPQATLTTLHTFNYQSATGYWPHASAGLVRGVDGNFYGTTYFGGAISTAFPRGLGTVFKMTPGGDMTVLHVFTGCGPAAPLCSSGHDGGNPATPMINGPGGNLYGTTSSFNQGNSGTIFRIAPGGVFTSFGRLPSGVGAPTGLVAASDGNLYGMTFRGTFFRVTPEGQITVLYTFNSRTDGSAVKPLVEGADGNLYGTAEGEGPAGRGTFFKITTAGVFTRLAFFGADLLGQPGPLVRGTDGNFYTTMTSRLAAVVKITPTGEMSVVAPTLAENNNLAGPPFGLVQGGNGTLYGLTNFGVFQVTTSGAFTILYRFKGIAAAVSTNYIPEGSEPSVLALGPDGIYGTFQTGGALIGGAVYKLTVGAGVVPPPTPAPPPQPPGGSAAPPGPLEAVDPNDDSLRRLIPTINGPSTTPVFDPGSYQKFAASSRVVSGLAADGVTLVVLRWLVHQPADVTFSLAIDSGPVEQVGSLGCIDERSCAPAEGTRTVTVTPRQISENNFIALALMKAPPDFVRPGARNLDGMATNRPIKVTAMQAVASGTRPQQSLSLTLARPPVVLLHGIWSDSCTWEWPIQRDGRFVVHAENYSATNAASFRENFDKPIAGIRAALTKMRAQGFAATQVDFVGHSMGGLLARFYAGDFDTPYIRDENLQAGDIHKLITLDSPHTGSELANALLVSPDKESTLGDLAKLVLGCIVCGAVNDLSVGSLMLSDIPTVRVPSHAIVGVGGARMVLNTVDVLTQLGLWGQFLAVAIGGAGLYDQSVFNFGPNDAIVSEPSQTGGLGGDAITRFEAVSPFDGSIINQGVHFTVTKEPRVNDRVIELLNAPAASSSFAQFQGRIVLPGQPQQAPQLLSAKLARVLSPRPGNVVVPGDRVPVRVDEAGSFAPERILLIGANGVREAPFESMVQIPADAIGPLDLYVIGMDAQSEPVRLQVEVTAALWNLDVTPEAFHLDRWAPQQRVTVNGLFADGVPRDLSGGALGTTYIIDDPSIAHVSSDGLVTALRKGETVLRVTSRGVTAAASIRTSDGVRRAEGELCEAK